MFENFSEIFKNMSGMREQAEVIRERVSRMQITGESGAGMVRVTVTGDGRVTNVKMDPTILSSDNTDMVEELIIAATNDALQRAKEAVSHEMKSVLGATGIPGLDKFFGG